MKIVKGETADFNTYEVIRKTKSTKHPKGWRGLFAALFNLDAHITVEEEIVLRNVVTADDDSGLLVLQILNDANLAIYTNGDDEITIDNVVKLLLLVPSIKQGFLMAGFRPKMETLYAKDFRIVRVLPDALPMIHTALPPEKWIDEN